MKDLGRWIEIANELEEAYNDSHLIDLRFGGSQGKQLHMDKFYFRIMSRGEDVKIQELAGSNYHYFQASFEKDGVKVFAIAYDKEDFDG